MLYNFTHLTLVYYYAGPAMKTRVASVRVQYKLRSRIAPPRRYMRDACRLRIKLHVRGTGKASKTAWIPRSRVYFRPDQQSYPK